MKETVKTNFINFTSHSLDETFFSRMRQDLHFPSDYPADDIRFEDFLNLCPRFELPKAKYEKSSNIFDCDLIDWSKEKVRLAIFEDKKSNYASIESIDKGIDPMKSVLCVMSNADNSSGLILASSPTFKRVFGTHNVAHSMELPFHSKTRKFNEEAWYRSISPRDFRGYPIAPPAALVEWVEYWAQRAILTPPRMDVYIDVHTKNLSILKNFFSIFDIHSYSIDEGGANAAPAIKYFYPELAEKNPYQALDMLARDIQRKVYHELGLYTTIGMGDNFVLAKLAMDTLAKKSKNMRGLIRYQDIPNTLWKIDNLEDFWGIGRKTAAKMEKMGIHSIYDLAHYNPDILKKELNVVYGLQNFMHANGVDETDLADSYTRESTSFSNNQTLPYEYEEQGAIELVLKEMVEQVAVRIRKTDKNENGAKLAKSISWYVGYGKGEFLSHGIGNSIRLQEPTDSTKELQNVVMHEFKKRYRHEKVKRVGVGIDWIDKSVYNRQLDLWDSTFGDTKDSAQSRKEKNENLVQEAVDKLRKKFGFTTVQKATSLKYGSRATARSKLIGGHTQGSAGGLAGLK